MAKYSVYVLFSKTYNKIYIGQTGNIEKRILEHNAGESNYTRKFMPWELIHLEEYETRSEAMIREKQFKSERGRRFIWDKLNGGVR